MTGTSTRTTTYTVTDVRKVMSSFEADLMMLARATRTMDETEARSTAQDVTQFAVLGYLQSVQIYLHDAMGNVRQKRVYDVATEAVGWANADAGANRWSAQPGDQLSVHVHYTPAFRVFSLEDRIAVQRRHGFNHTWTPITQTLNDSHLRAADERTYASNGYGLTRRDWK